MGTCGPRVPVDQTTEHGAGGHCVALSAEVRERCHCTTGGKTHHSSSQRIQLLYPPLVVYNIHVHDCSLLFI